MNAIADAIWNIEQSLRPSYLFQDSGVRHENFDAGLDWIEKFITQPHADLGRKGAVCPFVQGSHESNSLYFANLDADSLSFASFIQVILQMPALYERTLRNNMLSREQFSLAIFIGGVARDEYPKFIDMAHSIAKPVFMDAGLMLGEFHPDSRVPGVHSPIFRPMRSRVPVFVMRAISAHDRLFIDRPDTSPVVRMHELECYAKWLSETLSCRDALRVADRIAHLRIEISLPQTSRESEDIGPG